MLNNRNTLFLMLGALLTVAMALSLALGPVSISLQYLSRVLVRTLGFEVTSTPALEQTQLTVRQIRLPRALLGLAVGAVLALFGVAMQGLFRNPLADPSLIGVSSGAALGAAVAIVGGAMLGGISDTWSLYILSIYAFAGGLAVTALAGAAIGLFTYLADDATLRTLTFCNLGSQLCALLAEWCRAGAVAR